MKRKSEAGYNERIFGGGIRRWLHLARFEWAKRALNVAGAECQSVLELGCFDGRAISYLTRKPTEYVGLDANWEGGLTQARKRFSGNLAYEFHECLNPDDFRQSVRGRVFDSALCLETLEHVDPPLVDGYIKALSEVVRGVLVITVPTEKGPVFLAKHMTKVACGGDSYNYSPKEILFATLGMTSRVERNQHKGFDYQVIVKAVARHFEVLEVSPYPMRFMPRFVGFGVGILARTRNLSDKRRK